MNAIYDFLFSQYDTYSQNEIILEIIAVIFGVLSVIYSYKNNILVYPTGILSTAIFVYLLFKWGLLGDMIVNFYYTAMSIYGWYIWTRKVDDEHTTPITKINKADATKLFAIMVGSSLFVTLVYIQFDKLKVEKLSWVPYVDIFTTAVAFAGMWLMAKRKLEHWYFWLIVNIISIPLYFIKGYTFTSFQYIILLILAVMGVFEWRKLYYQQDPQLV